MVLTGPRSRFKGKAVDEMEALLLGAAADLARRLGGDATVYEPPGGLATCSLTVASRALES